MAKPGKPHGEWCGFKAEYNERELAIFAAYKNPDGSSYCCEDCDGPDTDQVDGECDNCGLLFVSENGETKCSTCVNYVPDGNSLGDQLLDLIRSRR
jgi:hypothetical protein